MAPARTIWALVAVETLCLLGAEIARFGITIWIYESSRSVSAFSALLVANLVPGMIARPFAGSIVDRSSRKAVMIGASLVSLAGTAIVLAGALAGELSMAIVVAGASLASVADAFQWPALEATIPLMASEDDLPRYNGFMESGRAIGHFAGPAIGGFLFAVLGVTGLVSIELATFVIATVVVAFLAIPRPGADAEPEAEGGEDAGEDGSLWSELSLGFRWIFARKALLKFLLVATFANFFLAIGEVVMQPYGLSFLSERAFGISNALFGAGSIAGGIAVGVLARRFTNVQQFLGSAIAVGIAYGAYGFARGVVSFAALNFAIAALMTIGNASIMTVWQTKVPEQLQGRVFSAMGLVADVMTPLSFVLAAPLAESFAPRVFGGSGATAMGGLFTAMGAALVVGFVLACTVRDVRQVEELPA